MQSTPASSLLVSLAVLASLGGCGFLDPDGSGGGTGGLTSFTEGFAFVRKDDRNVYVTDKADGFQEVMQVTSSGGNKHPCLSRDGKQVLFVHATSNGSELQLATLGSSAAPSVVLASDTARRNFRNPVFSPDGTVIVFAYDKGAASYLGKVSPSGVGFEELGSGTLSYSSPSFYPDGKAVLAAAGNPSSGYTQLERVDLASGAGTNVTSSLGDAASIVNRAVLSKDGTRVAFDGRLSSGASRIFVFELSSKSTRQLTDYPGDPNAVDSFPTWVGAAEVAFSNDLGGSDQVYSISATASNGSGKLKRASAIEPWYGP